MAINDASREAILEAIREFDRSLRETPEWQDWTKNEAHKYAIQHEGQRYPVKKIISLASDTPVSEFSGGEGPSNANRFARERGFPIVRLRARNPSWSRDELIVTLEFYLRNRERLPGKQSAAVRDLSVLLNRIGREIHQVDSDDFRNPNGVYMKLMNFLGLDPRYKGSGLEHGGAGDKAVWEEFGEDPLRCALAAKTIISATQELEDHEEQEAEQEEDFFEAEEGRTVTRVHQRRERNRKIIEKKKNAVLKSKGVLECEACGLNFEQLYGSRGRNFIECHHTKPVHEMTDGEKTKLSDLALLCSNCHRMVHTKRPWLSLEELRSLPGIARLRELWARASQQA